MCSFCLLILFHTLSPLAPNAPNPSPPGSSLDSGDGPGTRRPFCVTGGGEKQQNPLQQLQEAKAWEYRHHVTLVLVNYNSSIYRAPGIVFMLITQQSQEKLTFIC